jgi:hypothetical protein
LFDFVLNLYVELFSLYDDANRVLQKEKEENKDNEILMKILLKIQAYFQHCKLTQILSRNKLQLSNAIDLFN